MYDRAGGNIDPLRKDKKKRLKDKQLDKI